MPLRKRAASRSTLQKRAADAHAALVVFPRPRWVSKLADEEYRSAYVLIAATG